MTRKAGDVIAIGDQIVVRVMEIQGGKVQLGIDAPKDVRIETSAPPPEPARK